MPRETVGDRLAFALRRSHLNDYEAAERANVTAAWLSAVKNDRIGNPPLDKLRALAGVLDVPLRYFTEPLGVVPVDEIAAPDPSAIVIGGRDFSGVLTPAEKDIVKELAERLERLREPE